MLPVKLRHDSATDGDVYTQHRIMREIERGSEREGERRKRGRGARKKENYSIL